MKTTRLIAGLLTAALLAAAVTGCGAPKGIASTPPATPSAQSTPAPKIQVMDFDKKLDLKKPIEPVPAKPYILFLGNSYLFTNDLPSMFAALSQSGGLDAQVSELSDGGYHLSYFSDPSDELGAQAIDALARYEWDYVVMQEQSRLPTQADMIESEMLPAAKKLDEMIKAAKGQSVMMMTWAYKDGDDLTEFGIDKVTTREEMQTELANSYISIAQKIDSLLSPAGIAFIRSAKANPKIELWDAEDNMHPTIAGSYLASCVLYATLYNKSPVGLTFVPEGITAADAAMLQQTAADVVLG